MESIGYSAFFFTQEEASWKECFYHEKSLIVLETGTNEKPAGEDIDQRQIRITKNHAEISWDQASVFLGEDILLEKYGELKRFYSTHYQLKGPTLLFDHDLYGISYIRVHGTNSMKENIVFYTSESVAESFGWVFFSNFNKTPASKAFTEFAALIAEVIKEGKPQKIDVENSIAFNDYFLIEQEKSHYFGIIDNEYAFKPQRIFSMNTRDLYTVVDTFVGHFCRGN